MLTYALTPLLFFFGDGEVVRPVIAASDHLSYARGNGFGRGLVDAKENNTAM